MTQDSIKSDNNLGYGNDPAEVAFWFWVIVVLALALRLFVPLSATFPLNDGGLFYSMILDLEANYFALPATTSYNQSALPFAYPPLGLYFAAIIHTALPFELLDILRIVPPLVASLCLIPAWKIICILCSDPLKRLLSFAAYGLAYQAYEWAIMGGGITRAPGMLFALLSIWACLRPELQKDRGGAIAGISIGLTFLSHPHCAAFLVITLGVLCIFGAFRPSLRSIITIAVVWFIVLAPWFYSLIRHGNEWAFLQAMQTSRTEVTSLLRPFEVFFESQFSPIVLAGGLVFGAIVSILQRNFLIVVWFASLFIIPRLSSYYSMLPVALLFGSGASIFKPLLLKRSALRILLVLVVGSLAGASVSKTFFLRETVFTPNEVAGLRDLVTSTPAHAKFLVISSPNKPHHFISEWFPALASRNSLLTLEGKEWSNAVEFKQLKLSKQDLYTFVTDPLRQDRRSIEAMLGQVNRVIITEDTYHPDLLPNWEVMGNIGALKLLRPSAMASSPEAN